MSTGAHSRNFFSPRRRTTSDSRKHEKGSIKLLSLTLCETCFCLSRHHLLYVCVDGSHNAVGWRCFMSSHDLLRLYAASRGGFGCLREPLMLLPQILSLQITFVWRRLFAVGLCGSVWGQPGEHADASFNFFFLLPVDLFYFRASYGNKSFSSLDEVLDAHAELSTFLPPSAIASFVNGFIQLLTSALSGEAWLPLKLL